MSSDHGSIGVTASEVIALAHRRRATIITAESCTAGALSTVLASASGAGSALQGGLVTYTKRCKSALLGIPMEQLRNSAVTADVARAMAEGALRACLCADVAVAVTGVAGPEPDEDGNRVGLAFIAVRGRNGLSGELALDLPVATGGQVRGEIVLRGLELLRETLQRGQ